MPIYDDPEVAAMQRIVDCFEPLSPAARQRIIVWAMDRFGMAEEDPAEVFSHPEPPVPALQRKVQPPSEFAWPRNQVRPIDSYPPGFGDR